MCCRLQGVRFLHQHRQLHRDIKPSNILMTNSGVVKIADLGIARQLDTNEHFSTTGFGSELYLSPERQAIDKEKVWPSFCVLSHPVAVTVVVVTCALTVL